MALNMEKPEYGTAEAADEALAAAIASTPPPEASLTPPDPGQAIAQSAQEAAQSGLAEGEVGGEAIGDVAPPPAPVRQPLSGGPVVQGNMQAPMVFGPTHVPFVRTQRVSMLWRSVAADGGTLSSLIATKLNEVD